VVRRNVGDDLEPSKKKSWLCRIGSDRVART
jgi:hypothetical protein